MRLAPVLVLVALLAAACTSSAGFDRGALRDAVADAPPDVTDADIARVLAAKPQLPAPFRLAVHFAEGGGGGGYGRPFRWRQEDVAVVTAALAPFRPAGAISDVVPLDASIVEGNGIRAIRLAAARTGADAVLVVRGGAAIDDYNNFLAASYVALVTRLFVPGDVTDALFVARGSMWDVRNEYLYLAVETEGTARRTRPTAFTDDEGAVDEARRAAVAALARDVAARLASMR